MTAGYVDNSVRIEAYDHVGLLPLAEYLVRCPFSLARMINVTDDGKAIYRTSKSKCLHFPEHGDEEFLIASVFENSYFISCLIFNLRNAF
jgi:hypothetical protein